MANCVSLIGFVLTFFLIACSSSDDPQRGDGDGSMPDASVASPDGATAMPDVQAGTAASVVPCAGADIAGDIWFYDGIGYMGSALNAELPSGAVVEFHDMSTHTADHTGSLFSASGTDSVCVKFDSAGRYEFRCYFHSNEVGAIDIAATVGP